MFGFLVDVQERIRCLTELIEKYETAYRVLLRMEDPHMTALDRAECESVANSIKADLDRFRQELAGVKRRAGL